MSQRPAPIGICLCGCGRATSPGRYFVQGHDRKASTILDAISHARPIIDRLVAAGYTDGVQIRTDALSHPEVGYRECRWTERGCQEFGRYIGMWRHEASCSFAVDILSMIPPGAIQPYARYAQYETRYEVPCTSCRAVVPPVEMTIQHIPVADRKGRLHLRCAACTASQCPEYVADEEAE